MNYYKYGSSTAAELAHKQSDYQPGKFGKVYIVYLQEYRRGFFNQLVATNDLASHVQAMEKRAEERYNYLLSKEILKEHIDDNLKASNIRLWKEKMKSAEKNAEEAVIKSVIFN